MDSEDLVDAGDAALQALLAALAERTSDSVRRDKLLDFILTLPPLREWPTESLMRLQDGIGIAVNQGRRPDTNGWTRAV